MEKSVFQILNEYDITEHLKKKDRIIYLPWSKAWMIVKSLFPSAKFTINKAADGCIYHTDGKTAWVEVSITINDQTETESLAVMDFRNKSIPMTRSPLPMQRSLSSAAWSSVLLCTAWVCLFGRVRSCPAPPARRRKTIWTM